MRSAATAALGLAGVVVVVGAGARVVVVTLGAAAGGAPVAPDVTVVRADEATAGAPDGGG